MEHQFMRTNLEPQNMDVAVLCDVSVDSKHDNSEKLDEISNDTQGQDEILQELPKENQDQVLYNSGNESLAAECNYQVDNQSEEKNETEIIRTKRKFETDGECLIDAKMRMNTLSDEKKIANLRKNIRDVMGENQLDNNTIAAQKEESERLARVAEQQKIIREYQRQTAVNKQNVRTQNRVLSLLQSGKASAKITDLTDNDQDKDYSDTIKVSDLNLAENYESESPAIHKNRDKDDDDVQVDGLTIAAMPINDIVTIEDSSSEDDCILLSDDDEEDIEPEIEDDPSNSGLHVKDTYNVPDEKGRVVINIGHPEGEDDIFVAPQIAKAIKPHQIGGIRFLFDNIVESTKRFNSSTGFGCILAHSMGLGKTMQVVCFCDIFLKHTDSTTVLCVMPINTLQNWVSEFNMWLPTESVNTEEISPRAFKVFVLNDQQKTLNARGKVILKWAEEGGVLLMGYELFRLLALKLIPNRKRRVGKNFNSNEKVETEAHKKLAESIHKALVKPGPDLVICDEGHRIKNSHAGISLALKQIRTRRRIVLTGYPLQNNLMEYWCMVDFVRPNYLGTRTEFSNMFERPIQNGQCIDSTPEDIKLMRYRAHVLHSLLVGFVQRRSHVVLQQSLPQKLEYVILTKMNNFQRELYDTFMNKVVRKKAVPNPLKAFSVCCKIWNHPDVLYNFLKKRETDLDLEIDDADNTAYTVKLHSNKSDNTLLCSNNSQRLQNEDSVHTSDNTKPQSVFKKEENIPKENVGLEEINATSKDVDQSFKFENSALGIAGFNDKIFSKNYQKSHMDNFFPDCNGAPSYWHESDTPYYGYQALCGNIGPPQRPDYVGLVITKSHEQENVNSSSQIVDLDTKEIKTVETDIDVTINQIASNNELYGKDTSNFPKRYEEMCSLAYNSSKTKPVIDTSKNGSSGKKDCGLSGSFEKDLAKTRSDDFITYDWATDIMKEYEPNLIWNSPKMEIFFCILNESIRQGDRVLLFSQSLLTLNLIESFLQMSQIPECNKLWARNVSYFRLDGSTPSMERERLVNDFNSNSNIMLFLISTKAGSLGINLVGANRVIVFDASWNPCHDTQAVYRIYRYGQEKPCFVYRIVMDKCLEKKIYDRQVKKQGMSDRVVDECNPDAHLSMKDVTNLCYDYDADPKISPEEFKEPIESYNDVIIQRIIEQSKDALSKEPFYHESLLIDRKEKKLSLAEKRQAQRSYEMEKRASSKQVLSYQANKLQYRIIRNDGTIVTRPVASVRPMQTIKTQNTVKSGAIRSTRWIPAEVWQRQGMTAQEMTLPLDVVIPTNSSDKTNIILKSGQRVMVLKSPKGIYMQLESGKIIAIRTSSKINTSTKNQINQIGDIRSDNKKVSATISSKNNESAKLKTDPHNSSDVIIINEDKNIKHTSNQENLQKHVKAPMQNKKPQLYDDFGAHEVTEFPRNESSSVSKLIPRNSRNDTINSVTNSKPVSSELYINSKSKKDEKEEIPFAMKSFAEDVNPKNVNSLNDSTALKAQDIPHDSSNVSGKLTYSCSTQGKEKSEYVSVPVPQILATPQRMPQRTNIFPLSHQLPSHQHQEELYASACGMQQPHYVHEVPEVTDCNSANAFQKNLETTHHAQYFDAIYEPSYEYPHRYASYPSHNSYSNAEQNYHPHFSNPAASAINTHPYYMHWPTSMPTVAQSNNSNNFNSLYPQNGNSVNQWHNQR